MNKRQMQFVILCEDRVHEVFLRRFLNSFGFETRKLSFFVAPPGQASAEQFVKLTYGQLLLEYRLRNPVFHRFLVMIDADTGTVRDRHQQLDAVAITVSIQPRQTGEGIIHLVPKRNIETWIHRLFGQPANEDDSYKLIYKKQNEREFCQPAAEALHALVLGNSDQPDLPSLSMGVIELREKLVD